MLKFNFPHKKRKPHKTFAPTPDRDRRIRIYKAFVHQLGCTTKTYDAEKRPPGTKAVRVKGPPAAIEEAMRYPLKINL